MELQDIRKEIDALDRELTELFCKRMELSAAVAEYKRRTGTAVLDPEREKEIITNACERSCGELEEYTRILYTTILELSRRYQSRLLDGGN